MLDLPLDVGAVLATTILDHLLTSGRYEEAIAVADVLLKAYPAYAYALVKKGTAYYRLLDERFMRKYPKEADIPADQKQEISDDIDERSEDDRNRIDTFGFGQ